MTRTCVKRTLQPPEKGFYSPNLGHVVLLIWRNRSTNFVVDQSLSFVGCVNSIAFILQPLRRWTPLIRPTCGAELAQIHHKWMNSSGLCFVDNMVACLKSLICGCLHISKYVYTLLIRSFFGYSEAMHLFMMRELSYLRVLTTGCREKSFWLLMQKIFF